MSTEPSEGAIRAFTWKLKISDGFCEYQYDLTSRKGGVSIHDLYELVRQKLNAGDVDPVFVDPNEAETQAKDLADALRNALEYIERYFNPGPIPAEQPTEADWDYCTATELARAALAKLRGAK